MKETSKCHARRMRAGEFERYFSGQGIDIGSGDDPLRPLHGSVVCWDRRDGDAMLMPGVADATYNFVYSSHCLEHLVDIPTALRHWVRILRPGGWLYIVVPDYCLYEKFQWPSRFNHDHKASFSLDLSREKARRDTHYNIYDDLLPTLAALGMRMEVARLEDYNFDYSKGAVDQTLGDAVAQVCLVCRRNANMDVLKITC